MKKIILFIVTLLTFSQAFSQRKFFAIKRSSGGGTKTINVDMSANTLGISDAAWFTFYFDVSQTSGTATYSDGTSTGTIYFTIPSSPDYQQNSGGYSALPMIPDAVTRTAWKTNSSLNLVIHGLDNSKTYDITFYCTNASGFDEKVTFTIGATSIVVHDNNNTGPAQSITGVSPTGGTITFTMTATDFIAYLNGFTITEH